MKSRLTIICLFALTFASYSQVGPDKIIDLFFSQYKTEGPRVALSNLYSTNPWFSRNQDAIENSINSLSRFNKELVGDYYGHEFITKRSVADSYVLISYFAKFDRQFLRFTFQFYKPNDDWRLASFQFDDDFDEELEQAAKLHLFKF